jgi:hypothetical protein
MKNLILNWILLHGGGKQIKINTSLSFNFNSHTTILVPNVNKQIRSQLPRLVSTAQVLNNFHAKHGRTRSLAEYAPLLRKLDLDSLCASDGKGPRYHISRPLRNLPVGRLENCLWFDAGVELTDVRLEKSFENKSSSGHKVPVTYGEMTERKVQYCY